MVWARAIQKPMTMTTSSRMMRPTATMRSRRGLAREVAFARGGGLDDVSGRRVVLIAPDEWLGPRGLFRVAVGRLQLIDEAAALLGEILFELRKLTPPLIKRIGFVAVPRHAGRL